MKLKEELEILKHIRLGTKEVLYYPYKEGIEPLPLRPISSCEMDQSFYNSLEDVSNEIVHLVINLKVNLIKGEERIKVSNEGYSKLIKFYDDIDYWIVYFGMKDFQHTNFSEPDPDKVDSHPKGYYIVREMSEIHEIADFILKGSTSSNTIVKEIFNTESGQEIAFFVFYLNQNLASIGDLTKLQKRFLLYSKGHIRQVIAGKIKEDKYDISGETMTVQDLLDKFGVDLDVTDSG